MSNDSDKKHTDDLGNTGRISSQPDEHVEALRTLRTGHDLDIPLEAWLRFEADIREAMRTPMEQMGTTAEEFSAQMDLAMGAPTLFQDLADAVKAVCDGDPITPKQRDALAGSAVTLHMLIDPLDNEIENFKVIADLTSDAYTPESLERQQRVVNAALNKPLAQQNEIDIIQVAYRAGASAEKTQRFSDSLKQAAALLQTMCEQRGIAVTPVTRAID